MNATKKVKVLLVIEECNPEWFSVPLVGYCYYQGLSQFADVTLVTHGRNQEALERAHPDADIVYIPETTLIARYAAVVAKVSKINGKVVWPLYHTLIYPVYNQFNNRVYKKFHQRVRDGEYDLVHAITPMMPRYPVKLAKACENTPFILGPVNGGVPFPEGFSGVANQEFAYLNFLRRFGRYIIPGYRYTYEQASHILSGSTYTMKMLKHLFDLSEERVELFYENGIKRSFLKESKQTTAQGETVQLLFVGRLVPYKGADMLVEALGRMDPHVRSQYLLTIVGDGSERETVERLIQQYKLEDQVHLAGWVTQDETLQYYEQADVFCFPSVREFGGAVVMEAMANGLPCIVVNNGGIGEYVSETTGFKIEPNSREYVITELAKHIQTIVEDVELRQSMSTAAIEYAAGLTWEAKTERMLSIYQKVLERDG